MGGEISLRKGGKEGGKPFVRTCCSFYQETAERVRIYQHDERRRKNHYDAARTKKRKDVTGKLLHRGDEEGGDLRLPRRKKKSVPSGKRQKKEIVACRRTVGGEMESRILMGKGGPPHVDNNGQKE